MVTASDSNVFLDLLDGNPAEIALARNALNRAVLQGSVIISTVCYAELAPRFNPKSELDDFLRILGVTVSGIDEEIAFLAGHFYKGYRERGGNRTRILADFLIAAHAQLRADRILTRDKRFFGGSFPNLKAIAPADL